MAVPVKRAFWTLVAGAWLYGAVEMQMWRRDQRQHAAEFAQP